MEKQNRQPAVLFRNVRGSAVPVVTNLFGHRDRLALALDTTGDKLNQVYREREKRLIPPLLSPRGRSRNGC